MGDADIAAVTGLLDVVAEADGRPPLSDHLYLDLVSGGRDGFAGLIASDPDHGEPIAYAQVSKGNDNAAFELVVHPDHRSEMTAIGAELMDAALDVVRGQGGGEVNWWVFEPTADHRLLAEAAAMTQSRTLFQMRRSLPTERHATIATRDFVPGTDEASWLRVNNRAFADHGEQGGWDIETLRTRQQEDWFDPAGFRMYERDGRVAGFCWTKIHPGDREASGSDHTDDDGEIYVIAIDPDFHGLGLGSELTLAGLDHLADIGITSALLYVDASNEGAVAMYRKLGFDVAATNTAFTVEVTSGPAPESTIESGSSR